MSGTDRQAAASLTGRYEEQIRECQPDEKAMAIKRRESAREPELIDEIQRELERLDAEIEQAHSREVGAVMERILKMMAEYSISRHLWLDAARDSS